MKLIPDECQSELADPNFGTPAPVDMLLGVGVWAAILQDGSQINNFGIAIQSSQLGWLVYGGGVLPNAPPEVHSTVCDCDEEQLDMLLRRFWEIEENPQARARTAEQEQCERFFLDTHSRSAEGRYTVNIPLRSDVRELGSSRESALKRYHALERRFERDPELRQRYTASMNELLEAEQMIEITRAPVGWCYHIPHHAVQKKFRIVFDASCKTNKGISLNDTQLVGEKLQDDLFSLIMRFRTHQIGFTADIRKMYKKMYK